MATPTGDDSDGEGAVAGGRDRTGAGPPGVSESGRERRERRRRALLVGLVLVVLAGLAGILVPALSRDRQDQATGPAATGPAATGAAATGAGPGNGAGSATARTTPTATGGRPATTAAPTRTTERSATPPTPATGRQVVAPPGFTRYTDPVDGFSLVVPAGWRPTRDGTLVDFDDPNSSAFLRIDTSDNALPDPYQNWIDYERQFRQTHTGYQLIGIRRVTDYRPEEGWTVADWEFTLGSTHVLDRNIRVSAARAHAIYWSAPESQWNTAESRQILRLAEQSFVPAPAGS